MLGPTNKSLRKGDPPLLQEYCYDCHGDGEKRKVGTRYPLEPGGDYGDHQLWKKVWETSTGEICLLLDVEQPGDKEIDRILSWIEESVFDHDPQKTEPGRVVLRRLNRWNTKIPFVIFWSEYRNRNFVSCG